MTKLDKANERIKYTRNLAGLTRDAIAKEYAISPNTLQSWETGRAKLSEKGAKRLATMFQKAGILCDSHWLLTGEGNPPCVSTSTLSSSSQTQPNVEQELNLFKTLNPNHMIAILDDGLEPTLQSGAYAAGVINDDPIETLHGQIILVTLPTGETLVRKVLPSKEHNSFVTLVCTNSHTTQLPVLMNVKPLRFCKMIWYRETT